MKFLLEKTPYIQNFIAMKLLTLTLQQNYFPMAPSKFFPARSPLSP